MKNPPEDDEENYKRTLATTCYMDCFEKGKSYHACIISGRSISNERTIQCKQCHHYMIEKEVLSAKLINCPLCHNENATDEALVTILENDDDEEDTDNLDSSDR